MENKLLAKTQILNRLRKFDGYLMSELREPTDKNVAIYEHWIDCKYDIEQEIKNLFNANENYLLFPCKVGDTVWSEHGNELEVVVVSTRYEKDDDDSLYVICIDADRVTYLYYFSDFGKTVFLTQAEAEQKLKEARESSMNVDVVHCLSSLPATDGNFLSVLNRATDAEITQAIQNMESSNGKHKGRITACQRELRKRSKRTKAN